MAKQSTFYSNDVPNIMVDRYCEVAIPYEDFQSFYRKLIAKLDPYRSKDFTIYTSSYWFFRRFFFFKYNHHIIQLSSLDGTTFNVVVHARHYGQSRYVSVQINYRDMSDILGVYGSLFGPLARIIWPLFLLAGVFGFIYLATLEYYVIWFRVLCGGLAVLTFIWLVTGFGPTPKPLSYHRAHKANALAGIVAISVKEVLEEMGGTVDFRAKELTSENGIHAIYSRGFQEKISNMFRGIISSLYG